MPFPLRAALLGLVLLPDWGLAQGISLGGAFATDPEAPVEVTSETLTVDQATGAAVFTGNVVVLQGELRLGAAEVEVRYDEATEEVARLLASGGVTLATPSEAAEAQAADYDLGARRLTLTGEVLLTQGSTAIAGDRLEVDLETGTARMEGNVRTILGGGAP